MDRDILNRLTDVWTALGRVNVRHAKLASIFGAVSRGGWMPEATSALVALHPEMPYVSISRFCASNDATYARVNRNLSIANSLSAGSLSARAEFHLVAHIHREYGVPPRGPSLLHLDSLSDDLDRSSFLMTQARHADQIARHYFPPEKDPDKKKPEESPSPSSLYSNGLSQFYEALQRQVSDKMDWLSSCHESLTGCETPESLAALARLTPAYADSRFDPAAEDPLTLQIQQNLLASSFYHLARMESRLMMDYGITHLRYPTRLEETFQENLRAGFAEDSRNVGLFQTYCKDQTESLLSLR